MGDETNLNFWDWWSGKIEKWLPDWIEDAGSEEEQKDLERIFDYYNAMLKVAKDNKNQTATKYVYLIDSSLLMSSICRSFSSHSLFCSFIFWSSACCWEKKGSFQNTNLSLMIQPYRQTTRCAISTQ